MPVRPLTPGSRLARGMCGSGSGGAGKRGLATRVARLGVVARGSALAALAVLGGCGGALPLEAGELDPADAGPTPVAGRPRGPDDVPAGPGDAAVPSADAYAAIIVDRSIFDSSRAGASIEVPERDLAWVLLGTVAADTPAWSSALLAPADGATPARTFAVGEELEPGVFLAAVEQGKVRVRFAEGGEQELGFSDPAERLARRVAASAGGAEVVRRLEPGAWSVSLAVLEPLWKEAEGILEAARARTYARKGIEGVRLGHVRRGEVLYKLGLRSGDVLRGVDGRPVRTPDDLAGALRSAARSCEFTLHLSRRRKEQTFRYSVL